MFKLPTLQRVITVVRLYSRQIFFSYSSTFKDADIWKQMRAILAVGLVYICLILFIVPILRLNTRLLSPASFKKHIQPLTQSKKGYEVFGFAPYWTFDKLDNIDFNTLTTFAYFGVPVDSEGNLVQDDPGYAKFVSDDATNIFRKAHDSGTRVVLTITQMDNYAIEIFLDNPDAQSNAIDQTITKVRDRGIDGVNVDFEYAGSPDPYYRDKFTNFIMQLTQRMHQALPGSQVSVSTYAISATDDTKLYDIGSLGKTADKIFMMAYDFSVAGSDYAAPTAPLNGKKEGIYPYDVASSVDDYLRKMPAEKLILGVPYYGYNYPVYSPQVKAQTLPYWSGSAQTYEVVLANNNPNGDGVDSYKKGWDPVGKVGWIEYFDLYDYTWRMIFLEDTRSLGYKYDLIKDKNLAGVGIWALGFDGGHAELWALLRDKFGVKLANSNTGSYRKN